MPQIMIKSEMSTTPALVRFVNKSFRTIDITWVNFAGKYVKYKTIKHNQFVDVNTYTTHPWLFLDSTTCELMQVMNQSLYYATPITCPTTGRPGRKCVAIHLPLYSLKMTALLAVKNLLKSSADIDALEIPEELKNELKILFELQNSVEWKLF